MKNICYELLFDVWGEKGKHQLAGLARDEGDLALVAPSLRCKESAAFREGAITGS